MAVLNYTELDTWQKAMELVEDIYHATRKFPREEIYGLTSQLRRAAYSVPANIAEGASRESKRDYLHFLHIARGSLSEAQYFIHLARRLGYASEAQTEQVEAQSRQAFASLPFEDRVRFSYCRE